MAVQMINVGRLANDGTGDDLREAFIKINQNFQLFEFIDNPSGANLGSAGAEVFAQISDGEFQFRRLVEGSNISLTQHDNVIEISSSVDQNNNFIIVGDNSNTLQVSNGVVLRLEGVNGIVTEADENNKTVKFGLEDAVSRYLDFDFGEFVEPQGSILEFVINSIGVDLGTFTSPSSLVIDQGSI